MRRTSFSGTQAREERCLHQVSERSLARAKQLVRFDNGQKTFARLINVLKRLNSAPGEVRIHTTASKGVVEGRSANGPDAVRGRLGGSQHVPTLRLRDVGINSRLANQSVPPRLKVTSRERGYLGVREFLEKGAHLAFVDLDGLAAATAGAPMIEIIRDALVNRVPRGIGIRPRWFDDGKLDDVGPRQHADTIGGHLIVGLAQLALVVLVAVESSQVPGRRRDALSIADRDAFGYVDVIWFMARRQSLALFAGVQAYRFLQGCIPKI